MIAPRTAADTAATVAATLDQLDRIGHALVWIGLGVTACAVGLALVFSVVRSMVRDARGQPMRDEPPPGAPRPEPTVADLRAMGISALTADEVAYGREGAAKLAAWRAQHGVPPS